MAKDSTFSAEEKAAMREYAREKRGGKKSAGDGEADVLAAIAAMPAEDREKAEWLHRIVKAAAPELSPKTWYGMPAYARDDKVVCFFQNASKFKARYATLGFSDKANLDDGNMWPVTFAIMKMTPEEEKRIAALVKQAIS